MTTSRLFSAESRTYLTRFVLVGVTYALVAYLSLFLVPAGGTGASLVWPVSAVGLAALFFWGLDLWPALVLSFFILLVARGISPAVAAGVSVGDAAEALLGAYLLRRLEFHPLLSRLRDSLGLILVSFVATAVSATIIAASSAFLSWHAFSATLWEGLWVGHTVSLLSFAPFIIYWSHAPTFRKTLGQMLEMLAVVALIAVLDFFIFWTPYGSIGGISLIYILILPLIWASLRTGPRGISLVLFMTALVGATGILFGWGPLSAGAAVAQALFGIQVLIGTLSLIFLLLTSVTEERQDAVVALEGHVKKLETAVQQISSDDQAKTEFIAVLAHELRNPLSPVLSGLELLKEKGDGPPEVLAMMGAHVHTIARLLDDLLDITRITQKRFRLEREPVEFKSVIDRSVEMVRPLITARGHAFEIVLPDEDVWIDADPVRLSQVFVNLLNNAAKYTDPGGRIALSVAREDGTLTVRIKDSGVGIEKERLSRVFDAFGKGPALRPGGLRIGLSLAKRMAELHSGVIEARSDGVGQGSEFVVRLPVPTAVQPALLTTDRKPFRTQFSRKALEESRQKGGPLRVLVVDDNEAAAQSLQTLLEHSGHQVSLAYDGPQALALAATFVPQVVLLDIGLPGMDGYEVARQLNEKFGDAVALVALTGYGQEEDKQKSKDAGFDEHMVKPVSIVDVERVLASLRQV